MEVENLLTILKKVGPREMAQQLILLQTTWVQILRAHTCETHNHPYNHSNGSDLQRHQAHARTHRLHIHTYIQAKHSYI